MKSTIENPDIMNIHRLLKATNIENSNFFEAHL
jgi:hypothetical protein